MPKLERIRLINAAGFDDVEFPVGGHCQVFGGNGHGKSTLLRALLFFYLGTNDKAPYALPETKADFVSHYLGAPPSYLIYEVSRGDGQPDFHIAVTRPAGRIQFYFIDAPFRRACYCDGNFALPVERLEENLRDAQMPFQTYGSYDHFLDRIYGLTSSPYSVFRPASRGQSQVSVLPRIISGIFTVSQLDADKLKSALTCGVRDDALATELDLVRLKNQLEGFRRVHRAVKDYLGHEQEAHTLVDVAAEYERIRQERQNAIEGLVREAKLLPDEARRIEEEKGVLEREATEAESQHAESMNRAAVAIQEKRDRKKELETWIEEGEKAAAEYERRQIARKIADLRKMPELAAEVQAAADEYRILTAQYDDENAKKTALIEAVQRAFAETRNEIQEQRRISDEEARRNLERLSEERDEALAAAERERKGGDELHAPRRKTIDEMRTALDRAYKELGSLEPPRELRDLEMKLARTEREANAEDTRQSKLRGEMALEKQNTAATREKLDRDAKDEKERLEHTIAGLETQRTQADREVAAFDASLARFYQTKLPDSWPAAAKTLNRNTLFQDATNLQARASEENDAVWGAKFQTGHLPEPAEGYDRETLATRAANLRTELRSAKDQLRAAGERYIAAADQEEKRSHGVLSKLGEELQASIEKRGQLGDACVRLENEAATLRSQFDAVKAARRKELDERDATWRTERAALDRDTEALSQKHGQRCQSVNAHFKKRREEFDEARKNQTAESDAAQREAARKKDAEAARIEAEFQQALGGKGADTTRIAAVKQRLDAAEKRCAEVESFRDEVAEFTAKKRDWIDPLPEWQRERETVQATLDEREREREELESRHRKTLEDFKQRRGALGEREAMLKIDQDALKDFLKDLRFVQELGYPEREDLPPAAIRRPGAVKEYLQEAQSAHEERERVRRDGDTKARKFLNRFDPEILDRRVLGFSPIHEEHFDWFIFVGSELKPFVTQQRIHAMTKVQTQEFEELVRKICHTNADFREGIRQVKQTAALVQQHLSENNFVDVLDSIELKIDDVDDSLTRTLRGLEEFADISFSNGGDLFGKRADKASIERAISSFDRLLREIDACKRSALSLTDQFEFLIRVSENGHDMGWRKSLNDIGSTGTDYLLKMLIYLALIEIYRARAIESGATVHCVMDETGVLAPRYVRKVLQYAAERGIVLITAGHTQGNTGFNHWVHVRKHGPRFDAQEVLRKVLKCD
jgi:hypothetical protein